jgi:ATPase family associated with various cellular activities (AAA)
MSITFEMVFFKKSILPEFEKMEQAEMVENPIYKAYRNSSRYGNNDKFEVRTDELDWDSLDWIQEIAKREKHRSLMMQISALKNLLTDLENTKVSTLKLLYTGLVAYFADPDYYINGWLYEVREGEPILPYLVTKVEHHEPRRSDDYPYVSVSLMANTSNTNGSSETSSITINYDRMRGRTIPEILSQFRYYRETEELKEEYNRHLELYQDYQTKENEQFWVTGRVRMNEDRGYRGYYGMKELEKSKAVNDEGLIKRKYVEKSYSNFWEREQGEVDRFNEVPYHCYVYMFHLDFHKNFWVHVTRMEPYVYNENLRDKLILPQSHSDLIDILVHDIGMLQEDLISGKSGGTNILCVGKPGLGKTLSAEIYSEVIKKPLYKVHSGQLGLDPTNIEDKLEDVLKRAARWGAVLLIDEADVYIRKRGNDLEHNGVVASFLRTLEYFSGLLFMTSNRGEDIDDAIISRCIAIIRYETPSENDAKKIWRVLSDQYNFELSDELIDELVLIFPEASGRDIKELIKLTSKYVRGKDLEVNAKAFVTCGQFKNIKIVYEKEGDEKK